MKFIITAVVTAFVFLTMIRNETWRSEKTLWADVVAKSPEKPSGHINLGREYHKSRNYAVAVREYQLAMKLAAPHRDFRSRDWLATAQSNLGGLLLETRDPVNQHNGELALEATLLILPHFGPAVMWLSDLRNQQGRYAEAITLVDEALVNGFGSGFTEQGRLYYNKAVALCGNGFADQANANFQKSYALVGPSGVCR